MPMISDSGALAAFCRRLDGASYITVDTEFMRERTYWSRLCLVQVAGPDEARVIDALAAGMDLSPLIKILMDDTVLKVFHAARQDLEIFYHLTGALPAPVFDRTTRIERLCNGDLEHIRFEWLGYQERRFGLLAGQKTLWKRRHENHRHIEDIENLPDRIYPATAVIELNIRQNEARSLDLSGRHGFRFRRRGADHPVAHLDHDTGDIEGDYRLVFDHQHGGAGLLHKVGLGPFQEAQGFRFRDAKNEPHVVRREAFNGAEQ